MNVTLPVESILNDVPLIATVLSVLLGNNVRVSRTSVLPLTSSVAAGAVVLMPICELFWNMIESTMSLVVSHIGMKSTTPLPVTAGLAGGADELAVLAAAVEVAPLLLVLVAAELARTNAEAGSPPTVSASPALSA